MGLAHLHQRLAAIQSQVNPSQSSIAIISRATFTYQYALCRKYFETLVLFWANVRGYLVYYGGKLERKEVR